MGAATMEDMINQISDVDDSTGDEKIHLMFNININININRGGCKEEEKL